MSLRNSRMLWLLSGVLLFEVSVACGGALSGAACAVAALFGLRGQTLTVIAVGSLVTGFSVAFLVVLRRFAAVAVRGESGIRARWLIAAILSVPVAAPLWGLSTVQVVERLTHTESVRIATDSVMYWLALNLSIPVAIGVPFMLARLYRRSCLRLTKAHHEPV